MSQGGLLEWRGAATLAASVSLAVEQVTQPFAMADASMREGRRGGAFPIVPALLVAARSIGFSVVSWR